MEKVNVHSLYSRFKKNIHKKPYQIIGTMKSLALSTDDYSNFYSSAKNIFHRTTFKLPNETSYPILKKSQSKYISLKSKLNTFSFKDKKYEPKDLSIPFNKKIKYIISEEKKINIKEKKILIFLFVIIIMEEHYIINFMIIIIIININFSEIQNFILLIFIKILLHLKIFIQLKK